MQLFVTFGYASIGRPTCASSLGDSRGPAGHATQWAGSPLPDAVGQDEAGIAAGLPGGRQFPPGPVCWSTAGRPPDEFTIELTGTVGKAAHQALAGSRAATGNNGHATVCNGVAGASPGAPVAVSPLAAHTGAAGYLRRRSSGPPGQHAAPQAVVTASPSGGRRRRATGHAR